VRDVALAEPGFNARNSSFGKAYAYVVNTGDLNPFTSRWSWHMTDFLKIDEVKEAIQAVVGTHDFSSFTVERDEIDDPVRSIFRAEVKTFGPLVCLHFIGDGFLYKMVRSMVGTLVDIGRGRLAPSEMGRILEARNRILCRDTAPAEGLFLLKVFYEDRAWEAHKLDQPPFFLL
jgi:tRNA pseudouridine38-40 synthase